MGTFFNKEDFVFYLHFVYVFACIFGLVRLARVAETFLRQFLLNKINDEVKVLNENSCQNNDESQQRLKQLEIENVDLKQKLEDLLKLKQYETKADLLHAQQNVFISNRFFHLTQMNNSHQNGFSINDGQAFRNVWEKYFALQKQTRQLMDTAPEPNETIMPNKFSYPKIVSTEELQAIHGLS